MTNLSSFQFADHLKVSPVQSEVATTQDIAKPQVEEGSIAKLNTFQQELDNPTTRR